MSKKLLSIIVLSYNRLEYTKQTIENLIEKTNVDREFIFVDNGSIDGTREYLKSLMGRRLGGDVRLVFNSFNYGVGQGRNSGLKIAKGDYLMTIDDDILVPDNYDVDLIRLCDNIPNLGATGVSVEKLKYTKLINVNGIQVRAKAGNLGGGCLCISRAVFNKVGYFKDVFTYGIEDVDLYLRLRVLKLRSLYIANRGKHIDERDNKEYERLKRTAHTERSRSFRKIGELDLTYKKTGNVYVPYTAPKAKRENKLFDDAILKRKK